MYNSIFSYSGYINNRKSTIRFIPDFLEAVAIDDGFTRRNYYSDENVIYGEHTQLGTEIYVPDTAFWFIEEYQNGNYKITITNRTPSEIYTPLGEMFNRQVNQLMKEARFEYFVKKQKELRLYLYDKGIEWLKIISSDIKNDFDPFLYKYDINRPNTEKTYIDRAYLEPKKSCFLIGKIEKTIATHGVYIDYIQPIYEIPFDFEYKEGIPGGEFNYRVLDLANRILTLLLFAIQKDYKKDYYTKKIREYNKEVTIDDAICSFKNEIIENFKQGDTNKLKKLSILLEQPTEAELKLEKYN